jgi:uncharacterized membrane protein YesL
VTPGLGHAVRAALGDAYYHSWRLVPANLVWTIVAVAVATIGLVSPYGVVLLPVLALPTAGIFRVTTRIVRGGPVSFWDAVDAWRTDVPVTLGLGVTIVLVTVVLGANTVVGLTSDSAIGWGMATLAAWGLLALVLLLWTAWPIVVDPARARTPLRARLRLAGLLVLASPVRIALLAIGLTVFLALSAVAIVVFVTIGLSLAALIASREILPAADRLEERLAVRDAARSGDRPPPVEPSAASVGRVSPRRRRSRPDRAR